MRNPALPVTSPGSLPMTPELWVQADLKRVGEELKDWEATMRHEALLLRDQVTSQGSGEVILARRSAQGLRELCIGIIGVCLLQDPAKLASQGLQGIEAVITVYFDFCLMSSC